MPLVLQGVALHQRAVLRDQQIRRNILMTRLQIRQDPEDRYTRYIQRLLIDDVQLAQKLLPLCSNLTSLALYFSSLLTTEVMIMHPLMPYPFHISDGFTFSGMYFLPNTARVTIRFSRSSPTSILISVHNRVGLASQSSAT